MRTVCPGEELAHISRWWGIRGLSRFHKQTAAVQVVKITMMLGFLKCIFEEVLDFRDLLQRVVNLEPLDILNNPGHLMVFAKVDQLLLSGQGRRPVGWISLSAECDISQVQA